MSNEEVKVIKTESCPSLSGRGTVITYATGRNGDSKYIQLVACTSSAIFSKAWVSVADIQQLLAGLPNVTSKALKPLYVGKSANSPGFLAACVINENLHPVEKPPVDPDSPPSKPAKVKKDTSKEK